MRLFRTCHSTSRTLVCLLCLLGVGCASSGKSERGDRKAGAAAEQSSDNPTTSSDEQSSAKGEETRQKAACRIEARDWRGLDFHDAEKLHRSLVEHASKVTPCLEVFPSSEKFYVIFEVKPPRVVSARPAELSKNMLHRLGDDERANLRSCLEKKGSELDLEVDPASDSYEVTHPFCTPE